MSSWLAHLPALIGSAPGLLCLAPVLALVVPLLLRRYPGERLLTRLTRGRRTRWPRPTSSARPSRRVMVMAVRGGLLLARSLAVRPPPPARFMAR